MRNILIIVLLLGSCVARKNIQRTEVYGYTFEMVSTHFDTKNFSYIGFKRYCVGSVIVDSDNPEDCPNCYSENNIYVFWNENGKSFVQKFDNCSKFNTVEIINFYPSKYLDKKSNTLQEEKVDKYTTDNNTFAAVSHSCFRSFIINDGISKYENGFDLFDLTGENYNLRFESNNSLELIKLNVKLEKVIDELENENRFHRDKKTCIDNSLR